MSKGYDEKCWELAKYFLSDEGHSPDDEANLAQDIQDAVENWFGSRGGTVERTA